MNKYSRVLIVFLTTFLALGVLTVGQVATAQVVKKDYKDEAERSLIISNMEKQGFRLIEDQIHFDGNHLIFSNSDEEIYEEPEPREIINDLVFSNEFKIVEATGSVEGLIFLNQVDEEIIRIDEEGNLILKGSITKLNQSEEMGLGTIFEEFIQKVKQTLVSLGLFIENGMAQLKELVAEKIFTDEITTKRIRMVDKATGEIYCTWIENGEWVKVKGECAPIDTSGGGFSEGGCQSQTFYYDGDGDGFGNYGNFISVCETPAGYVSDNTDCDDGDASINPAVTEICDDGIDNDCDGEVDAEDEDCQAVPPTPVCDSEHLDLCETEADCLAAEGYWYNDQCNTEAEIPPQEVCDATHLNLCTTQAECETVAGFWYNEGCNTEPEAPACTPSEEICDGIDNDCDGQIDEGGVCEIPEEPGE